MALLIPPLVIGIIVFIVVFLVTITVVYWKLPPTTDPRLAGYFAMFMSASIFVTLIALIITSSSQVVQTQHSDVTQELTSDYNIWVGIEQMFLNNANLTRLYKQIYPNNAALQLIPDPEITPQVQLDETHACQVLFQTVDTLNTFVLIEGTDWTNPDYDSWLTVFRSWFQSPIVQEQWLYSRQLYGIDTQTFVNQDVLSGTKPPIIGTIPPAVFKS